MTTPLLAVPYQLTYCAETITSRADALPLDTDDAVNLKLPSITPRHPNATLHYASDKEQAN